MSTVEAEVDLGRTVLQLVDKVKDHLSHLTDHPHRKLKVKVDHIIKESYFRKLTGMRYWITQYGIVPIQSERHVVEPLGLYELGDLPPLELIKLKDEVVTVVLMCGGVTFNHGLTV